MLGGPRPPGSRELGLSCKACPLPAGTQCSRETAGWESIQRAACCPALPGAYVRGLLEFPRGLQR